MNSVGNGEWSNEPSATTDSAVPGTPGSFTATPGDGQVELSWTAPASNGGAEITKYQIQLDSGSWNDVGTTTAHTVSSLTNGTGYSFKVRAVNSVGAGTPATVSATPAGVPGTPGSFTATPGDGQVELSWTAPASNGAAIAKYQVQRDSGSWNDVTGTSHTVSSLTNGTSYSFKVRAVNSVGAGTPATASATPAAVPGTPGSLTATPGDGQVELSWTAPANNGAAISKYQVQQDSGSWNDVTGTSHTVSSLTNGTSYSFKVRAVNSVGAGTPATASATPAGVPGTPGSFTATPGDGQVELSWTAPASNGAAIAKYQVQQDSGSWNDVTGTSHTASSLTNGTSYSFKVRAVNSVGAGTPATASATPAAVPGTPGSLTATPGDGQVELSWTAPASNGGAAITKYQVQRDSGSWNDVTGTSHTVSSLTNGTSYSFKVRAVNSVGAGTAASASATPAQPNARPAAPTGLTATPATRK